jgi:hypothetical protein
VLAWFAHQAQDNEILFDDFNYAAHDDPLLSTK